MFSLKRASSSAFWGRGTSEVVLVRCQVGEGRRGWERWRIWEVRKVCFRERIVGGVVVIFCVEL